MIEYQKNTFTEIDNPFQLVLSPEDLGAGVWVCQSLFWVKYILSFSFKFLFGFFY